MLSESSVIRKCGCGVVAVFNLLSYLRLYVYPENSALLSPFDISPDISRENFDRCVLRLSHRLFPVIPPLGTSGFALAAGLNIYFAKHRLPLHARWGVSKAELWESIDDMLSRDIPVILGIGQNLPAFWQHHLTPLYIKQTDEAYRNVSAVNSHFVTVTGSDAEWIRISSWGKEYYISKNDFSSYVREHSSSLVSTILYIKA